MTYSASRKRLYSWFLYLVLVALAVGCTKPTPVVITPKRNEPTLAASPTIPPPTPAPLDRVAIDGASWFLFGANYPWNSYGNDFGENTWGHNGVSAMRQNVDADFKTLADMGVRVVRWFVFTDGRAAPEFAADGSVSGLDGKFFTDMDAALLIAQTYNIRLIPVLLDFHWLDPQKEESGVLLGGHADVITDPAKRQSFYQNALLPVLERYGSHPYILVWEIINEPEWAMDDPDIRTDQPLERIPPETMQSFVSETTEFIHTHADQYVTVGSASRRWWHLWQNAGLDVCQVHYYPWMEADSPLAFPAAELDATLPCLIGEFPSVSSEADPFDLDTYYQTVLENGYAGAFPWSLKADDDHSGLTGFASTVQSWARELAPLIEIPLPAGWPTPTAPPLPTQELTATPQALPSTQSATVSPVFPTIPADPSQYGFELRDGEWVHQTYEDSQAVTEVSRVTSPVHLGNYALQLDMNLVPGDPHLSKGEAFVDIIAFAPLDNSVGPYDLSNSTITCWMYVPREAYAVRNSPWIALQVFAKDSEFDTQYSSWRSVQVTHVDQWLQVQLKPRRYDAPNGFTTPEFDPTTIKLIGVKLGVDDYYARPGVGYTGPVYLDSCTWD